MRFQLKKEENGIKNLFRDKKTISKTPLMLFDLEVFTER